MPLQYKRFTAMENRLIAFNEAENSAQPEARPDTENEQDAKPIDGARVFNDIEKVLTKLKSELLYDVPGDSIKDFRASLDAIRKKYEKLDETKANALQELEKEIYKEFSPFLQKAAQFQLSKCKNIQNPTFEKGGVNFTFGGETMAAELTDLYEVRTVQVLGAMVQFQKPIRLKDFDYCIGNNILSTIRLVGKRFDTNGLVVSATEARCEFTANEDGVEKKIVATPLDVLEVKQAPTPQKIQEWMEARDERVAIRKRMGDSVRSMLDVFKGNAVMLKMVEEFKASMEAGGKTRIDTGEFTFKQKQLWNELLALQDKHGVAQDKERALRGECGTRVLQANDGTQVREEGFPELEWSGSFHWVYLDKEEMKETELVWFQAQCTEKIEYEKGEKIRQTNYWNTGMPESEEDFRKGTKIFYDRKGRQSFRQLYGPDNTLRVTHMYDSEGKLLDEKALQAMTPAQIDEKIITPLLALRQGAWTGSNEIKACYSAAEYIIQCPRGEDMLRRIVRSDPRMAFEEFAKYRQAPYAVKLLEEAAYQMNNEAAVARIMNDAEKVPGLSETDKTRIIEMAQRQKTNMPFAETLLYLDSTKHLSELLEDPGLRNWSDVKEEWIDWKKFPNPGYTPEEVRKIQMRAMIARNLYFQHLDVTEQSVKNEFLRIVEMREKYRKVLIFKGRNVLHVAHSEMIRDLRDGNDGISGKPYSDLEYERWEESSQSKHRFGKKGTQDAIKEQQDGEGTYEMIRPEKNIESLQNAKTDMLQKIKTMAPPSTFIFDGHGGPDALYLSDGTIPNTAITSKVRETDATVKITAEELTQALVERGKKFPQLQTEDPSKKDIFIFISCYNANFIRNLYEQMSDTPKPIAIGASEYGQYAYSDKGSKFGSMSFSRLLDLGPAWNKAKGQPTTLSDVFLNEFTTFSNPSMYIPDDKNLPMQIMKNDSSHGREDESERTA